MTRRSGAVAVAALWLAGCSLTRGPEVTPSAVPILVPSDIAQPGDAARQAMPSAVAERIASIAESLQGSPYRFGGDSPTGFDCSGLVRYVHARVGITVPRTAAGQMLASHRVARAQLQRGDLVFFATRGPRSEIDHVGIYAGNGEFLHAPRAGRSVGPDRLETRWFDARYVAAGRFWSGPEVMRGGGQRP